MNSNNFFINESIDLTQIDVQELQIGMYVSKLDRSWLETSFLFQGFELKTVTDIKEVQKQCDFVYIDIAKQTKVIGHERRSQAWVESRQPPKKTSNFKEEFSYAKSVFRESSGLVKGFMESVAIGRAINVEIAKKAVAECVDSIIKSPDALMWLTQLKERDEYTSQHSMNVCILSIALARQINLPREEIEKNRSMWHDA